MAGPVTARDPMMADHGEDAGEQDETYVEGVVYKTVATLRVETREAHGRHPRPSCPGEGHPLLPPAQELPLLHALVRRGRHGAQDHGSSTTPATPSRSGRAEFALPSAVSVERGMTKQKIAVVGATGRAGRHVVEALEAGGHEAVRISRADGVDVITGKGLTQALQGVGCVVDVATGPSPEEQPATEFFTTAAANLQREGAKAGVKRASSSPRSSASTASPAATAPPSSRTSRRASPGRCRRASCGSRSSTSSSSR